MISKQIGITKNNFSVFDVHVHVGLYEHQYNLSTLHIQELCQYLPIECFVCAPVSWEESINEHTINSFKNIALHTIPLFWLWISPVRIKGLQILNNEKIPDGYAGIKLHPFADCYDFYLELLHPVFLAAEKWRVPVAIHTGNEGCDPISIANAIPTTHTQPVILFHSRPIDEAITVATSRSCIYLESSFCEPDEFSKSFDVLGPDRILFGSDYPLNSVYYPGLNVIDLYRENVEALFNLTEKQGCTDKFFQANAASIFAHKTPHIIVND